MEKHYDFKEKSGDTKITVVISFRDEHELFQREMEVLKDWKFDKEWELIREYYPKYEKRTNTKT